ncbi:electron transfer flavoprotein beta subunit lysine methyltransferase isoform X2 [Bos taurus]|uniref:electron transfer flavoprotein beta subunit lysine methyltransferase isoform X2 n=1 Tax=Bos taurus TaxID=9913 RepID=UPI0028CB1839|nr:electron transfer flavoprotein beta subunit lysine methyltransferase isoform X2 [Bos taurus]
MALSPGWRVFASFPMNRYVVLWKAVRSSGFPLFPWGHCPWRGTGSLLDPKMKAFLEENTEVTSSGSLTPEIRLRLLTPRCKFWWERADLWPLRDPYWAIYWPGGQALSRYLLDNPDVVRGKSVLDIGSGCGATAIAAKMSGALRILANDIDPSKPFSITVIKVYALTSNIEEAEAERFYEDLQDLLELTPHQRCPFHHRGLECKSRKSRNTWSNRQIWPWSTE